jgi:uncharacterized protein (DUF58 family)
MFPIPASGAAFAFLGSVAMLAVALAWSSPMTAWLASGCLLGLAAAFALTIPLGARLRRQRLEFVWSLDRHDSAMVSSGVLSGVAFELRCQVVNRGGRGLRFSELAPVLPAGVVLIEGVGELWLPARTRTEFALRLRSDVAGRVVLHGLAVAVPGPFSLFLAPLYFPSPLTVRVLPRSASASTQRSAGNRFAATSSAQRAGPRALRQRGAGAELYELREHRAGDAFNTIAWKASARVGKLIVREVEREVQEELQIILDVSGSMRGGAPGERKLDHCIELCTLLSQQALSRGDRVGLITVDGRILARVVETEGLPHMSRIYEALLDATEVVDADLTEVDDDEVTAMVGLYLRQQHGVELIAAGRWDRRAIIAQVERALLAEPDERPHAPAIVASSPEHALLRRFCRVRGICLPYRATTRRAGKGPGLAHALRTAVGASRAPRTVLVVSDLDGVEDSARLWQTVQLLKFRKHALAFIFPDAESFAAAPRTRIERELRQVYAMQEQSRRADVQSQLGKLGIPLLTFAAQRGAVDVVHRVSTLRRVA